MALQGEAKAKYMQTYRNGDENNDKQAVVHRLFTIVTYYNFANDMKQIQRLIDVSNKYTVKFYFVWHDTHMHGVIYSRKERKLEEILKIVLEAGLDANENSLLLSYKTLEVELRYALHLDDPDKKQYHPDDFIVIGTADPLPRIRWSPEEMELYVNEIADYVEDNNITSARVLQRYIDKSRMYKFVYRKQAFKKDIDNIINENRDNVHHNEQTALLMQLIQQQSKQSESVSEDKSVSESESKTIIRTAKEVKEIAKRWRAIEVKSIANSWHRFASNKPLTDEEKYDKMLKDNYDPLREQALLIELERLVA